MISESYNFEIRILNNFDFCPEKYKLDILKKLTLRSVYYSLPRVLFTRLSITFATIVNKTHLGFNSYHIVGLFVFVH